MTPDAMPVEPPSPARLLEVLDYNRHTGELIWRRRPITTAVNRRWNARYPGKRAGQVIKGNRWVTIDGQRFFEHFVVQAWIAAEEAESQADGCFSATQTA